MSHDDATEVRAPDQHPTFRQPASFAAGDRINDRYVIEQPIGAGPMSNCTPNASVVSPKW